jgi:quercetin dioxygenase-like cupin family protein
MSLITRRRMIATTARAAALAAIAPAAASAQQGAQRRPTMEITRSGSQPSQKGPAEYFTGAVRVDSRFQGRAPARVGGGIVTFEPGARTAWHTHPLGQTLIVTSGRGWVQVDGGAREDVLPGDIVWFGPGERHWHGATATTAMSHIAIAEALDGKTVDWLEKVTDAQYGT